MIVCKAIEGNTCSRLINIDNVVKLTFAYLLSSSYSFSPSISAIVLSKASNNSIIV